MHTDWSLLGQRPVGHAHRGDPATAWLALDAEACHVDERAVLHARDWRTELRQGDACTWLGRAWLGLGLGLGLEFGLGLG